MATESATKETGILTILYRNHRGVTAVRSIVPVHMRFGTSEFHPDVTGWFLVAVCMHARAVRDFLCSDILAIGAENVRRACEERGIAVPES